MRGTAALTPAATGRCEPFVHALADQVRSISANAPRSCTSSRTDYRPIGESGEPTRLRDLAEGAVPVLSPPSWLLPDQQAQLFKRFEQLVAQPRAGWFGGGGRLPDLLGGVRWTTGHCFRAGLVRPGQCVALTLVRVGVPISLGLQLCTHAREVVAIFALFPAQSHRARNLALQRRQQVAGGIEIACPQGVESHDQPVGQPARVARLQVHLGKRVFPFRTREWKYHLSGAYLGLSTLRDSTRALSYHADS